MPVTKPVDTKRASGRRKIRYETMDEFMEDAVRLANCEVKLLGNWSQGQIYEHLSRTLDLSIDGSDLFPAPVRLVLRFIFKRIFLHVAVPAGFSSPAKSVPDDTSVTAGLESLRRAMARQKETEERAPHPGFGKFTRAEWDLFHLRHAELHMSFIVEPTV